MQGTHGDVTTQPTGIISSMRAYILGFTLTRGWSNPAHDSHPLRAEHAVTYGDVTIQPTGIISSMRAYILGFTLTRGWSNPAHDSHPLRAEHAAYTW